MGIKHGKDVYFSFSDNSTVISHVKQAHSFCLVNVRLYIYQTTKPGSLGSQYYTLRYIHILYNAIYYICTCSPKNAVHLLLYNYVHKNYS